MQLTSLHKVLFSRVADFDLAGFTEAAEIQKLEEHFQIDLLILVDSLLANLSTT